MPTGVNGTLFRADQRASGWDGSGLSRANCVNDCSRGEASNAATTFLGRDKSAPPRAPQRETWRKHRLIRLRAFAPRL
jgi:hypothetical protein